MFWFAREKAVWYQAGRTSKALRIGNGHAHRALVSVGDERSVATSSASGLSPPAVGQSPSPASMSCFANLKPGRPFGGAVNGQACLAGAGFQGMIFGVRVLASAQSGERIAVKRFESGKLFEERKTGFIETWQEFIRFPSVSSDPDNDADCRRCAEWLAAGIAGSGLDARLVETPGKPLVLGERLGKPGRPTILLYGHYDVQPVDPIEEWISPPFSPEIRAGRLFGRGAQDNKGQFTYAWKAIETLLAECEQDISVKVIVEGEEESGSAGIAAVLPDLKSDLRADILLSCDTGTVAPGIPTITLGLRGIAYMTVTVEGPLMDLHSGVHGGKAPNPATELARLLATLHNPDGSIAIDGFYDGVSEPTEDQRVLLAARSFDPRVYERATGVAPVAGESRFSPAERVGFRPSLDINGISSGYCGHGMKTIIPKSASAKISVRLVPGQEPQRVLELLESHLGTHAPRGLILTIAEKGAAGGAVSLDPHSPHAKRAAAILHETTGKQTVFSWCGASIPVISLLSRVSGAEPLLVGFGNDEEDRIHAPNESFSLEQFKDGFRFVASFVAGL